MRPLLLFLFFSVFLGNAYAQRTCLSEEYALRNPVPQAGLSADILAGRRDTLSNEVITIPVVVHVIHNTAQQNISDEQIQSQIDALNKDFRFLNADKINIPSAFRPKAADVRIQFCLARVDPGNRPTKGIVRKFTGIQYFLGDDAMKFTKAGGSDSWDHTKYLNIWVCNMFGRSLGYATLPGSPADKDGVVINWDVFGTTGNIRAPFNLGRTTTHEVAHWLGLKHIWGDDICGSDDVDDTPNQKSYNFYCPVFPKISNCSPDNSGDMFMNYMDLTDDACMNMFTAGQGTKMRGAFSIEGYRNSFLNSNKCDSSKATGGPLPEEIPVITLPEPVPFVELYPNPVTNNLTLISHNNFVLNGVVCNIYNIQGKLVLQKKLMPGTSSLNMSPLTPGVYFLRIGNTEKKMYKLIKI